MSNPPFPVGLRPPVVYLPGVDGTGRLLYRQRLLHERFEVRCVAYPQDTAHSYSDLVGLAADELRRAGRGVVLAESFGGAVALMLALRHPELVERLVLVNTFAHFPRVPLIRLLARVGQFLPARPGHPATRAVRARLFFSPDVPPDVRAGWWERTADVPMSAYGHRFGLIAGLDLRPRLHEVRTPALVLAAPDDRVVPVSAGRSLTRRLPNARLVTARVGHAAMAHPAVDVADLLPEPLESALDVRRR